MLLATLFIVAGAAKLIDPRGSRDALRQFGVANCLVRPLALVLPIAELSIAVGLFANASARWAALGAFALLVLFVVGIVRNLAQGKHPDCHCFGQLHSAPIGWQTLVRNGVLAGAACMIFWQGPGLDAGQWLIGLGPVAWLAGLVAIVLIGIISVQGWFVLNLLSQQGRLLLRLEAVEAALDGRPFIDRGTPEAYAGLPVGRPAPDFELREVNNGSVTLRGLLHSDRPLLLVFSDPGCGPCTALLPEVGRWQRELSSTVNIVLISRGDVEVNRTKARDYGLSQVLVQKDREVAHAYQSTATPGAVLIGADGMIASPVVAGADALRTLLSRTSGYSQAPRTMLHLPVTLPATS